MSNIGRSDAGLCKSFAYLDESELSPPDFEADGDNADLSLQLAEARRNMRAKLLSLDDVGLKDLYYRALMLSEHEAARRAVDKVLTRSSLSNKAEA